MAMFHNLFEVGQVLADMLTQQTSVSDVRIGAPLDLATGSAEAIRITLLWLTEQHTHRNDPLVSDATGRRVLPPLTLHTFFLVTTYGTDNDNAQRGYQLLGEVLQTFHSSPTVNLPLDLADYPAAIPVGKGQVSVVHMPTQLDMLEKVFAPLQVPHRPWAVFEVGPVQLSDLKPNLGPAPLVRPGGVNLLPFQIADPPLILRITPNRIHPGGQLRIDARYSRAIDRVNVSLSRLTGSEIAVTEAGGPIFVSLPTTGANAVGEGNHMVSLVSGTHISQSFPLVVQSTASVPSLSSPKVRVHSVGSSLVLTGQNLTTVEELIAWPDGGDTSAVDVHTLPASSTDQSLVVTTADLSVANLRLGVPYRLSAHYGGAPGQYTPYVLLEFNP